MDEKQEDFSWVEKQYPETCVQLQREMEKLYRLFLRKMGTYGPHNIDHHADINTVAGQHLVDAQITLRVDEKSQRMMNIIFNQKGTFPSDETMEESWQDLSLLPIIRLVVAAKKWGK